MARERAPALPCIAKAHKRRHCDKTGHHNHVSCPHEAIRVEAVAVIGYISMLQPAHPIAEEHHSHLIYDISFDHSLHYLPIGFQAPPAIDLDTLAGQLHAEDVPDQDSIARGVAKCNHETACTRHGFH